MSASLYDELVKRKIAGWIVDPEMTVLGPDETARLFQKIADVNNDKPISLPLIAISRDRDIELPLTSKRPLTHMGMTFNSKDGISDHLNGIPMKLGYQLDIYTRYKDQAEEYVRNFAFNLINHPAMTLQIPYNDCNLEYVSYLHLKSPISDNSDIQQRLVPGQFTRMTMRFGLDDAYLFSYNHKVIPKISEVWIGYDVTFNVELDLEAQFEIQMKNNPNYTKNKSNTKNKPKVSVKILEE